MSPGLFAGALVIFIPWYFWGLVAWYTVIGAIILAGIVDGMTGWEKVHVPKVKTRTEYVKDE